MKENIVNIQRLGLKKTFLYNCKGKERGDKIINKKPVQSSVLGVLSECRFTD